MNDSSETDYQHKVLRLIWIAMISSIAFYLAVTLLVSFTREDDQNTLAVILTTSGMALFVISFVLKRTMLNRAFLARDRQQVQRAYILSWAFSEGVAILGLLMAFLSGSNLHYLLFLAAASALLAHYPRRDDLLAASSQNF